MEKYNPKIIENKWQKIWEKDKTYYSKIDKNRKKFYVLEMFPYPSGDIHMGHVRNYTLGDLVARFKRAQGYNVLHPMGWDSFGLPAENAAIENKIHPRDWTVQNIKKMKSQLKKMGLSYDWEKEISTCDVEYYKHEQKIFIELYKAGLAYKKETWVNWDPVEQTVLANEQVIDGKGWRSNAIVEKRKMKGWFLKISDFSEELLNDLKKLPEWPEKVKIMQKNWIGKSIGAFINFNVSNTEKKISVFSTRPDTIFGATFIAISSQHEFAEYLKEQDIQIKEKLKEFSFSSFSEVEIEKNEKVGIKTKFTVDHPFISGKKLPIFIANFVLIEYGTGAVFGCPAHDQRDLDFSRKYGLDIIRVVSDQKNVINDINDAYIGDGYMVNSDFLNGMNTYEAKKAIIAKLENLKLGKSSINYRLRDWGVSRQRYWGCPIPMINCKKCGEVPVPENDLPITLPENDVFKKSNTSLKVDHKWKSVKCPKCGLISERETDTFDTFFESSWYYMRFTDLNHKKPFDRDLAEYWLPVDQYIGGIEHAVLHLLYSRFFTKALKKIDKINITEPFKSLKTQGMVCHRTFKSEDGKWLFPKEVLKTGDQYIHLINKRPVIIGRMEKMSKSKKNVIDPNIIVNNYGADTARFFILSDSPPDRDMEWTESGLEGSWRFLNKVWNIISKDDYTNVSAETFDARELKDLNLLKSTNKYIKNTTKHIQDFQFNNAIASIRSLFNEINEYLIFNKNCLSLKKHALKQFLKLIHPICPHISSELWLKIGNTNQLSTEKWPSVEEKYLINDEIIIPIQINGKRRDEIVLNENLEEEEIFKLVLSKEQIKKFVTKRPKKLIYIPNRIINIVL